MSIVIDILNQQTIDDLLDNTISIEDRYDENGHLLTSKSIRIDEILICKDCKNHVPMAEPNQEDGSFICYSCRLTR